MTMNQITITTESKTSGQTERTYAVTWFADELNQRDLRFEAIDEALESIECDVLATWDDASGAYDFARVETAGACQQLVIFDSATGRAGFAVEV